MRPRSVTDALSDVAKFTGSLKLRAGASNENRRSLVPTTALTVTTPYACLIVLDAAAPHATVVPDVHDVVLHAADSVTAVVGVNAYDPKFSPEIVTDAIPEFTRFMFVS